MWDRSRRILFECANYLKVHTNPSARTIRRRGVFEGVEYSKAGTIRRRILFEVAYYFFRPISNSGQKTSKIENCLAILNHNIVTSHTVVYNAYTKNHELSSWSPVPPITGNFRIWSDNKLTWAGNLPAKCMTIWWQVDLATRNRQFATRFSRNEKW